MLTLEECKDHTARGPKMVEREEGRLEVEGDRDRRPHPTHVPWGRALESQPHPGTEVPTPPSFCCLLPLSLHFQHPGVKGTLDPFSQAAGVPGPEMSPSHTEPISHSGPQVRL